MSLRGNGLAQKLWKSFRRTSILSLLGFRATSSFPGAYWHFPIVPCALITIPADSKIVGYSSLLGFDKEGAQPHKGQPQPLSLEWNVLKTNF